MNVKNRQSYVLLYLFGTVPVVWVALLFAPYIFEGGIFTHLSEMTKALNTPFHIIWSKDSLKTILLFL